MSLSKSSVIANCAIEFGLLVGDRGRCCVSIVILTSLISVREVGGGGGGGDESRSWNWIQKELKSAKN